MKREPRSARGAGLRSTLLLAGCIGAGCTAGLVDGPSAECARSFSAPGCPAAPVDPPPACTRVTWNVYPGSCPAGDECGLLAQLAFDPRAEPPQARLRVGQRVLLTVSTAVQEPRGCVWFDPVSPSWSSRQPGIVALEQRSVPSEIVVKGLAPGDTVVTAAGLGSPAGPVSATLVGCAANAPCVPVAMVLRVVP